MFSIPMTIVGRVGNEEFMGGMFGERGVNGESGTVDLGRSRSLAKKLGDTKGAGRTAWGMRLSCQLGFVNSAKVGNLLAKWS